METLLHPKDAAKSLQPLQSSMMIRGLSPDMESVRPECAVLYPEGLSAIDNSKAVVMHENRNEAYDLRVIGSETIFRKIE